jgi:hypothetical protein|tara:strand:+ start:729 stop:857 length:129 start_codon:yes stop_codon:yes gene_type:complete
MQGMQKNPWFISFDLQELIKVQFNPNSSHYQSKINPNGLGQI